MIRRLALTIADLRLWQTLVNPRGELFIALDAPPPAGAEVLVDVAVTGGPRLIMRGTVRSLRAASGEGPAGCEVEVPARDRAKLDFLTAFVNGGTVNRRRRRRLPLALPVAFSTGGAPPRAAMTRDLHEEGMFIVTEEPYPPGDRIDIELTLPGGEPPVAVRGEVRHNGASGPGLRGMGIRLELDEDKQAEIDSIVDGLEEDLYLGVLPAYVLA